MPKQVIHDNDGHVDDLLSAILLWLSPEVDLQAATITNGDCYADQSFQALLKMATYLGLEGAEVAYNEEPVPNPFPENWRKESYIMNELPIFSESLRSLYQNGRGRDSRQALTHCLTNSREPLTLITTGPLTNPAHVLKQKPELAQMVEEMIIMGGAIKVPGNVEEEESDGSAEWNMYADPEAAKFIIDSKIPLKLIPLDVTNKLPVTKDFLERLEAQSDRHLASNLALKLWSLVKGFEYYFWDTVTVACVINPGLFTFKEIRTDITTSGAAKGRTASSLFGGRKINVAMDVNRKDFEELLLGILKLR